MTLKQLAARRQLTTRAARALQATAGNAAVDNLRAAVAAWLDGCPLGTRVVYRALAALETPFYTEPAKYGL